MSPPRWRVDYRRGAWRVVNPKGVWHDSADTLPDAHTYAAQCAVADVLFAPGGLSRLSELHTRWDMDELVDFAQWLSVELRGTPLSRMDALSCIGDWMEAP